LVVTADDFGLAPEVNDAVEAAHTRGILSAASLMVGAPATADAVARAKRLPRLRVGLHLALVEGRPVLPAERVPDLVDASGFFRTDMVKAGIDLFFRGSARAQLRVEIAAQFAAFRASGLALDHVNTHKHFHLHPTIASQILQIGRDFGLKALRIPAEPRQVLARIEPQHRHPAAAVTAPWAAILKRRVRSRGLLAADRVFGLAWSGAMTESRLGGLLSNLPDGLTEIYMHPATLNSFDGAAPGYRYTDELAALTAPSVAAALRKCAARLGGFADFVA
jgi:chitin disaccharide deacetylase